MGRALADWRIHAAVAALLVAVVALQAASSNGGTPAPPGQPGDAPSPSKPVPREPARLAAALADTTLALRDAIADWRETGNTSTGEPPEDVTLYALHQQRIYVFLGGRAQLAQQVIARLRPSVRPEARDILRARRQLTRLTPPTRRDPNSFNTGPALPAGVLLDLYRRAEERFRVSRRVLAAVNLVETGFNRIRSNSTAGAQGPMQFIPSTWRRYGMGGKVHKPRDAIMGAANYLRASGAPRDYRGALFHYNPSTLYVNAVLAYARAMRRRSDAYYALYSWQIFVRTPSGARRLTGPGR